MKTTLRLLAAASALALSSANAADDSFSGIEKIVIEDFIGTVTISVASGDVRVSSKSGDDADYPYWINSEDGIVTVYSDEDPDDSRWWKRISWRGGDDAFEKFLEDYPTINITVPAGTDLLADSAVLKLTAGDLQSDVVTKSGHIEGEIGDVASGKIGIHGSGDMVLGDVADKLLINIHGSGDFRAGTSATLVASIHGSGDIDVGDVAGDAEASVHGSGDILLRDVGGSVELSSHGSGDVRAGTVGGGLELSSHGSGDLEVASISGPASISQNGSGDVRIGGGRAEDLRVRISGSGDFEFDGIATNPDLSANGSGDIDIARHEGTVRARGRGDIRVSGNDYGDDD